MRLARRRVVVQHGAVPLISAVIFCSRALGQSYVEEWQVGHDDECRAASLLQRTHRRSQLPLFSAASTRGIAEGMDIIFPDAPDYGCRVGSSCSPGAMPSARGACVHPLLGADDRPNECWDICNTAHLPQDYVIGDAELEVRLARAIQSVRSGEYPHMRCPNNVTAEDSPVNPADISEGDDLVKVLNDIEDAETASQKAKMLASAANQSAAALDNADAKTRGDVAEIMKIAAEAEATAAEKAKAAAEEVQEIVDKREQQEVAENEDVMTDVEESRANGTSQDTAVQELIRQIKEALVEAKNDAEIKDSTARTKRSLEEEAKALAESARKEAEKAKSQANSTYAEQALAADEAARQARAATKVAKAAAANASDALLVVKKDYRILAMLEYKTVVETTARKEQEVADLIAAISNAKASGNSTDLLRNLTTTFEEKQRQAEEIKQVALEKKKALEAAKFQEKAAERNARRARAEADEANANSSQCRWIPHPSCVAEFIYGHETIVGCTDKDRYVAWCSTDASFAGQWKNCSYSCEGTAGSSIKGDDAGKKNGTTRRSVLKVEVPPTGLNGWGHGVPKLQSQSASSDRRSQRICRWKPDARCAPSFTYQGKLYSGCVETDKAWCSEDKTYVGRYRMCTYDCEAQEETKPNGTAVENNGVAPQ